MNHTQQNAMPNLNEKYDAIIVGTGPGGASVARGLSKAGKRVLILEKAVNRPLTGTLKQAFPEFLKPGVGTTKVNGVYVVRGVAYGGSSLYYHGTAEKPPFEMFDKHGIDLRPIVDEIYKEIPIGPLPDHLIGPGASRIMESAQEIGLPWQKMEKFIDPEACKQGGWLPYFLAPNYKSKWNGRLWVEEAISNGAELLTEADVRHVEISDKVATGVKVVYGNKSISVKSDLVVLAAGGIASPVILQKSGIDAGNEWFHDPLINVTAELPGLNSVNEFAMCAGVVFKDEGVVMTDIRGPKSLFQMNAMLSGKFNKLLSYNRTVQIMVKIRDDLTGSISADGKLEKPLTKDDRDKLAWGVDKANKIFKNAGAESIRKPAIAAAHPGGSAGIGKVVDSNLKTSVDGLYVCDCSVIPDEWGLPPTMTIIALGKYLVNHLTEEKSTNEQVPEFTSA